MTPPKIVSRDDWLSARLDLLEAEKALDRQRDEISRARRALPWVRVEADYVFAGVAGPVSLSELFGNRRQLIVYHFMYGPSWEAGGCPSCSRASLARMSASRSPTRPQALRRPGPPPRR